VDPAFSLALAAPLPYKPPLLRAARPKGMPWRSLNAWLSAATLNRKDSKMPKMKTKSGAKKRFKMTATGRVKSGVAGKRHRLSSHNADYIRSHRGTKVLKKGDESLVKWYMPYNR
jgi:large subunit ribosomal protein L35